MKEIAGLAQRDYPEIALRKGDGGAVTLRCIVGPGGLLDDCEVIEEKPSGEGFGAAALKIAQLIKINPTSRSGRRAQDGSILIPIRFKMPKSPKPGGFLPRTAARPAATSKPPPPVPVPQAETTAATVAAVPPPPQSEITQPDWAKKPTPREYEDVFPSRAMTQNVSGKATLSCQVDVHGVLDACQVVAESPTGYGFGAAALALAPRFRMKPMSIEGRPTAGGVVNIPITFETGGPIAGRTMVSSRLIVTGAWIAAPSFADVAAAYPAAAKGDAGRMVFRCEVKRDGRLRHCIDTVHAPHDFEAAARSLFPKFRLRVDPADFKDAGELEVELPMRLPPPGEPDLEAKAIGQPTWIAGPDPSKILALYPAAAADKGVKEGVGKVACTVQADGRLGDCVERTADPPSLGFSRAAAELAP
ncbi:MAG: TonB family protein, partial [Caulobacteraceae bacterium]